jgi:hypothetical protein
MSESERAVREKLKTTTAKASKTNGNDIAASKVKTKSIWQELKEDAAKDWADYEKKMNK